jgi:uncharacterized protein
MRTSFGQRTFWASPIGHCGSLPIRLPDDARIAVRFACEWHDDSGNGFRSYGNENWEFEEHGLMGRRYACINDLPIRETDRLYHWPLVRRPNDHPGLSDLGL